MNALFALSQMFIREKTEIENNFSGEVVHVDYLCFVFRLKINVHTDFFDSDEFVW